MKTLPSYRAISTSPLVHYQRIAEYRARALQRIDYWKRAAEPLHCYGEDRDGRSPIPVLCLNDRKNDLLGGALRSVRTFQDIMDAHDLRRSSHDGWYTDPDSCTSRDGSGLCWGVVAYLGHGRWLAGYVLGGTDCGGYHLDRIYDSELEAARAADEIARIVAEHEMEYAQKFRNAQALEMEIEEATAELCKALALRNDKRPCFAGMREEARELMETIRDKRGTLRADYAGVL